MSKGQKPLFVSIIWGYHEQLFHFSALENYHLHALAVAKELGYETEAYMIGSRAKIEDDPNFDPDTRVVYHRNTLGMIRFLASRTSAVIYANTVTWQNLFLVPYLSSRTIFMAHDSIKRRSNIKQRTENRALHRYTRVRVIAPGEKEFLIRENIPAEKIFVVPLSVDASLFRPRETPGTNLVFLGNVTPDNDFPTILSALARVREQHPDIRLNIIGEVRIPDFDKLAAQYNVTDAIVFHGKKSHREIATLLPSFAISISSVLSSGQHLSVFESALAGLALCLPDTMQFTSVFQDMARFHPVRDARRLSENICWYLERPEAMRTENAKARQFIQAQYSTAALDAKLKSLFLFS